MSEFVGRRGSGAGSTGPQGPAGPQGPQGPTGPQGPSGSGTSIAPDFVGQVLYAAAIEQFSAEMPLVSFNGGWLSNDDGILLIVG
jgi:hypothetical protein